VVIHGKMQRVGAGAASGIDVIVEISSCGIVCGPVPGVIIASRGRINIVTAGVDGEVEQHKAVATTLILSEERRRTGTGRVSGAMPGVAIASCNWLYNHIAMIDREVERHHTVAAVSICFSKCGCSSVDDIGISVPDITVAGSLCFDA